ncbi:unnamed protein product [Oikopleura dioica]|uniref:Uncharacterized protein n=1 Tax=Oikopleura dioica TaxID=34765 RepID=E4YTU2_OIKDI|nr:unnamed protein product [Oikopleura dioica]
MKKYFREFIEDDYTNTYATIDWSAEPEDNMPDINGNGTSMIMRGIEVDNLITIYANADSIHTKWSIFHDQPIYDYSPHPGCCNPSVNRCCSSKQSCNSRNGSTCNWNGQVVTDYSSFCQKGNPCGKADVMQQLW